jgi:hypothetical protein
MSPSANPYHPRRWGFFIAAGAVVSALDRSGVGHLAQCSPQTLAMPFFQILGQRAGAGRWRLSPTERIARLFDDTNGPMT